MLKWIMQPIVISVAGSEVVMDLLGYQGGKGRKIKYVAGPKTAGLWLKAYRTAEQVVEFDTNLFTTGWTLLPVDVTMKEGDIFKAGFRDLTAGAATYNLAIGYEESD
jgi:hypothetical protein